MWDPILYANEHNPLSWIKPACLFIYFPICHKKHLCQIRVWCYKMQWSPILALTILFLNMNLMWSRPVMARPIQHNHYGDVIFSAMASQTTSITIVCSNVYSGVDQKKHQISASLAFVRGIHRWLVNSSHRGPVTRIMFPFDDVIMYCTQPDSDKYRN